MAEAPAAVSGRGPPDRRALDFLAEEIIDRLPAEHRRFLLQTAIVDPLDPALGRALTERDDIEPTVETLTDAGLLTLAADGGARCLPPLRAASLRRLDREHGSERALLHGRAARHLLGRGRLDEAIAHAERARDHALLADLAAEHGFALLRARRLGRLSRLLKGIDPPRRRASPVLATLEAWATLPRSPAAAREAAARARARLEATVGPTPVPAAQLEVSLSVLEAFAALRQGEAPVGLEALLADDRTPPSLCVALAIAAGLAAEVRGQASLALTVLDRAVRIALTGPEPLPSGITALAHRIRVLRQVARRQEARRLGEQGEAALLQHNWSDLPVAAELAIERAMVEHEDGESEAAEARIIPALRALRLGGDPGAIARGLLGLAMIRRARGEHDPARDAAAEAEAIARAAGIAPLVALARRWFEPPASAPTPTPTPAPAPTPTQKPTRGTTLSARELEVLALVAQGLSNQIVGRRLFISPVTVKTHVHNILAKLEAKNRTEAVHRARQLGLLT